MGLLLKLISDWLFSIIDNITTISMDHTNLIYTYIVYHSSYNLGNIKGQKLWLNEKFFSSFRNQTFKYPLRIMILPTIFSSYAFTKKNMIWRKAENKFGVYTQKKKTKNIVNDSKVWDALNSCSLWKIKNVDLIL